MADDKVIKSGQITLPRIIFLAVAGGIIILMVAYGLLNLGYILLTIILCILLLLVAIDYGVDMDKVNYQADAAPARAVDAGATTPEVRTTLSEQRTKRRTSRPVKRRR